MDRSRSPMLLVPSTMPLPLLSKREKISVKSKELERGREKKREEEEKKRGIGKLLVFACKLSILACYLLFI